MVVRRREPGAEFQVVDVRGDARDRPLLPRGSHLPEEESVQVEDGRERPPQEQRQVRHLILIAFLALSPRFSQCLPIMICRLAKVWMDEYAEYYYQRIGHDLVRTRCLLRTIYRAIGN